MTLVFQFEASAPRYTKKCQPFLNKNFSLTAKYAKKK